MMKFFRRYQDLEMVGAQARRYDQNSREYRMGEISGAEILSWRSLRAPATFRSSWPSSGSTRSLAWI